MSISKVNVSGADYQIVGSPRYATCSTAAATAAKVATIADGSSTFSLEKGARICVSFTYANTASAATLNVSNTGAKAICWQGSALVSSQYWQAGAVVDFVYDGNGWSIVGVAKDNNSTNFLPLSGGSLTGNLTVGSSSIGTNGYIEGTWLKTTKVTESAGDFATISGDGWIYKRKPANVLGDIGGQAKITANGILKGDGTGTITAADETEVELVDITPESIGAQPKITAKGFLTSDGQGTVGAEKPVLTVSVRLIGAPTRDETTGEYIYNFVSDYNYAQIIDAQRRGYMVVVNYGEFMYHFTQNNSSDDLIFSTMSESHNCFYERFRCTSDDKWYREGRTLVSMEGPFRDTPTLTLTEVIQNLENEVGNAQSGITSLQSEVASITEKNTSIILYSSRWTGSDPYIQNIGTKTASTKVDIQPSEELYDQLVADGVGYLAIKNVDGTLTAVAKGSRPTVDLTVQITFNEVHPVDGV